MAVDNRIRRFRTFLRSWGKKNVREYPWRNLLDPYSVLVAEFMLHRTQARQVQPVYLRFLKAYPSLPDLVQSPRRSARRILQPLGLAWRAHAMLDALHELWRKYGEVPTDFDTLTSVHGIGQYIAGATICFTRNVPIALIDSNTVRVVGRVFGLDLRGEARRRHDVIETIAMVCDPQHPRDFYYSLIDLAHLICRPREPLCLTCPLLNVPCVTGQTRVNRSIH